MTLKVKIIGNYKSTVHNIYGVAYSIIPQSFFYFLMKHSLKVNLNLLEYIEK